MAILPAGARGRGGAKPTCATISGGKLPRTPCGRRRPTAREPRGILPPQPRENLTWSTWRIATWKHGPRGDFYTFTVSGHRWHGKCRVPVPCSRVGARRSAVASCARAMHGWHVRRGARGHGQLVRVSRSWKILSSGSIGEHPNNRRHRLCGDLST